MREAGILFALPTYAFVTSIFVLIGVGFGRCARRGLPARRRPAPAAAGRAARVTLFVVLRAFASGSTALTGVEAIANGVNAFRRPHGTQRGDDARRPRRDRDRDVPRRLVARRADARARRARPERRRCSREIARGVFPAGSPSGFMYWVVQVLTLAVLVLAANTSFQGFPRLAALLARDRFFAAPVHQPRRPARLLERDHRAGRRSPALLLWVYNASVDSLIHLYVIGVFTAFTLSQAGMVRYWLRTRDPGWRRRDVVNAVGATATGARDADRDLDEVRRGRVARDRRDPAARARRSSAINRHYRRFGRRLEAGAVGRARGAA